MRFLVVGLGSMGKRRIRNLQQLDAGAIIGFDTEPERRRQSQKEYGIETCATFEDGVAKKPDAIVISTPPDAHISYAIRAARLGLSFFSEVNVSNAGMDELINLCEHARIVAAPSCTMRFHPATKKIKQIVLSKIVGRPLAFTYHSGQYLPDWHPWEDYRKFYAAKRATGAAREIMAFELVWLTWVFGSLDKVSCMKEKVSDLDVDIDDVYQTVLKFKSKLLGHMLVDAIARRPYRTLRMLGEDGVVEWNWETQVVRLFDSAKESWTDFALDEGTPYHGYIHGEAMYIEEMLNFVEAVKGRINYPYTFEEDRRVLNILYAAEESSRSGAHIHVAPS